ncbi:MAG: mechanosensitive ion channel family protein [Gammaproteobacteria bacterium]|nr:mechanosensitive ion channel family protein [Gammaproteobacteria bacterium]
MNIVDTVNSWIITLSNFLGPNPLLQASIILFLFIIVAWVVTTLLSRIVGRFTKASKTDFDDKLVHMLHRPVFMTIFLVGATLALGRLELSEVAEARSVSVLQSISVWVWMVFALGFSRLVLTTLNSFSNRFNFVDNRTLPLLQNAAFLLISLGAVYGLMSAWHIDVTALVASAGILGLALSFAAKDTLANVFAGVSILADSPYKVGDFIVLGTGERGQVTQIGVRSTRILTRDDVEITVPNAVIGNAKIINETGGPHEKYRIRCKVSVSYRSDLDAVCAILKEVALNQTGVCVSPAPRVRVRTFGDHGIDIELLAWVPQPVERGRMTHELNLKIFRVFNENNIEIPYPQRVVHIKSIPEAGTTSS